jgi:dCTP deaminase
MILTAPEIARRLDEGASLLASAPDGALVISPSPKTEDLKNSASASVDLRLGTWFLTPRFANLQSYGCATGEKTKSEFALSERRYVRFGKNFILHPRRFVLAATLEWLHLPTDLCGYVTGKSSWGRHGLVIETAPGVHPGFTGCLTLELANVGEVPIELQPGLLICQLFLHRVSGSLGALPSKLAGSRLPRLSPIRPDGFARRLNHIA